MIEKLRYRAYHEYWIKKKKRNIIHFIQSTLPLDKKSALGTAIVKNR